MESMRPEENLRSGTAECSGAGVLTVGTPDGGLRVSDAVSAGTSITETPDKNVHIPERESGDEHEYLECEKRWVFMVLMMVGGFFGGFTFSIRGGVFCNAQTANIALLGLALGHGEFLHAAYYLIPIGAYLLGTYVSEYIALPIKRLHLIRWDTLFIIIEMIFVVILALIPETAPYQISQVLVNFICSMQYNTFRQAQSIPMATVFCTNHVRQIGIALCKSLRHEDNRQYLSRMFVHIGMLLAFLAGVILSVLLTRVFLGKAMFFTLIPLSVILAFLLHADLKTEKDILDRTPHGH